MNTIARFVLCTLVICSLMFGSPNVSDEPIGQIPPPDAVAVSDEPIGQIPPPYGVAYIPDPSCWPCN